jgi:hypothetical protein
LQPTRLMTVAGDHIPLFFVRLSAVHFAFLRCDLWLTRRWSTRPCLTVTGTTSYLQIEILLRQSIKCGIYR